MSLHPRNAPCPCGSGRKYKKCCLEHEPEVRRRDEALDDTLALPVLFPLLRPLDAEFERWAGERAGHKPDRPLIEEGLSILPTAECERIAGAHARAHADAWASLVGDLGDVDEARTALVAGAVRAALFEEREPCPHCLALVENGLFRDAAEVLAALVEPCDLWSIEDAVRAENDLDLERLAATLWSSDHERRLQLLVARVAERLPKDAHVAAAAVADFGTEPRVRRRLAVLLLEDVVPALRGLEVAA